MVEATQKPVQGRPKAAQSRRIAIEKG